MAEALIPGAADRRLATLAAAFLPASSGALARLSGANSWLREETGRLAAAPRRERLLALHRALAQALPTGELALALSAERGALPALLQAAAAMRPGAPASHPLLRLCQERLLTPPSTP